MTPEQAIAQTALRDAIRERIKQGCAEKLPNGDYRIEMGSFTQIYGADYVERIMEFAKEQ